MTPVNSPARTGTSSRSKRSRFVRTASAAAVAGLLAAGCGGSDDAGPAPQATDAPVSGAPMSAVADSGDDTPSPSDSAVPALLQFDAPLIGGGDISGAELADKPTAFWFWSPF